MEKEIRYFDPEEIRKNGRQLDNRLSPIDPGETRVAILGTGERSMARDHVQTAHLLYENGLFIDFEVYAVLSDGLEKYKVDPPAAPIAKEKPSRRGRRSKLKEISVQP